MAEEKNLTVRIRVLGYWIDSSISKAYAVIEYLDAPQDIKHTNVYFVESDYKGK